MNLRKLLFVPALGLASLAVVACGDDGGSTKTTPAAGDKMTEKMDDKMTGASGDKMDDKMTGASGDKMTDKMTGAIGASAMSK